MVTKMEQKLIDVIALKHDMVGSYVFMGFYELLREVCDIIDAQPTIDAVPVVRCKDCKHHGTNGDRLNCNVFCCTMPDEGFCSGAERKEE